MTESLDGLSHAQIQEMAFRVIDRLQSRTPMHRERAKRHQELWTLHQPTEFKPEVCRECSQTWPCGIIASLTVGA